MNSTLELVFLPTWQLYICLLSRHTWGFIFHPWLTLLCAALCELQQQQQHMAVGYTRIVCTYFPHSMFDCVVYARVYVCNELVSVYLRLG